MSYSKDPGKDAQPFAVTKEAAEKLWEGKLNGPVRFQSRNLKVDVWAKM